MGKYERKKKMMYFMGIIILIILIVLIAVCITVMILMKMESHREKLLKVVESYVPQAQGYFSESDRQEYRDAVMRGEYDMDTTCEVLKYMRETELHNWCMR